jgi:2-aminobenzoylacetyl-CoA thioesterase
MIIAPPSNVTPSITLLGRFESNVHWVHDGDEAILIGGGMAYMVPDLLSQMGELGLDPKRLTRLVILHAHFDHVGIAPYFKRQYPWIQIVGSRRAQALLGQPKVQRTIGLLNDQCVALNNASTKVAALGCGYEPFGIEQTVGHGDEISVGDLRLRVYEVPGHSSCSIATYLPAQKALFPSDAAGVRAGDFMFATGNSNFLLFQRSLAELAELDVEVLLPEHYGVLIGAEAREHLPRMIAAAERMWLRLQATVHETGDVAKSTEDLTDELYAMVPKEFFPKPVLQLVISQMVRFTAKHMAAIKGPSSLP